MDFEIGPGFCKFCGTVLPMVADSNSFKCTLCKTECSFKAFGAMEASYVINFNSRDKFVVSAKDKEDGAIGPIVERRCPKCNNDKMSYATLQLRSADEGQTVFYTCTKCKYKETENS